MNSRQLISTSIVLALMPLAAALSADEQKPLIECHDGKCIVSTISPHAAPQPHSPKAEAPDVLHSLEQIVKAYSSGDLKTYEGLLDNDCTYFDQEHNTMITGKPKVLEHLKASFEKHAPNGTQPLLTYTIDQPYIKVSGKMAVVTYRAFEEVGGAKKTALSGLITKVFIKDGTEWKQQHDSSYWRVTDAAAIKPASNTK